MHTVPVFSKPHLGFRKATPLRNKVRISVWIHQDWDMLTYKYKKLLNSAQAAHLHRQIYKDLTKPESALDERRWNKAPVLPERHENRIHLNVRGEKVQKILGAAHPNQERTSPIMVFKFRSDGLDHRTADSDLATGAIFDWVDDPHPSMSRQQLRLERLRQKCRLTD